MPLHVLQRKLGHANIDMTMRYATFNPAYSDVQHYFERVDDRLGLGRSADNRTNNTPAEEAEEEATREAA